MGEVNKTWDDINLSSPKKTWRIIIDGELPSGDKETKMSVSFFEGSSILFTASGIWKVQGHSSSSAVKKNWKLTLINSTTGNKINLKIGDWLPISALVLKAYATDRTLIRDILTTELWRNFHQEPDGLLAPLWAYAYFDPIDCGMHTGAQFSTDGFPVEVFTSKGFMGLYVLRTGIDARQYLMDVTHPNHILTQAHLTNNFWVDGQFIPDKWEYVSPATINDTTNQACQRLISWIADCVNNKIDMKATYKDYIDLTSWIDYILICEISVSFDSLTNNFLIGSWDAFPTKGIWRIYPYDADLTFGIMNGVYDVAQSEPEKIGWVTQRDQLVGGQYPIFFECIHKHFNSEIRARWRYLRDHNFITSRKINEMIKRKINLINPQMMTKDLTLWNTHDQTGLGFGYIISDNGKKWSVSYIMDYAKRRIAWLDQQFKYYV